MRPSASPKLEMLLGLEVEFPWRADLAQLLVRGLVTDRNVGGRHVWNGSEVILKRFVVLALLRLAVADGDFELRDLFHQRLGAGLVLCRLGLTDAARSSVAAGLRLLQFLNRCPALLVQLQNLSQGFAGLREAAIGQPFDEGVPILANPFDVEQGLGPTGWNRGFPIRLHPLLVIARLDRAIQ